MGGFKFLSGGMDYQTIAINVSASWDFVFDNSNATEYFNNYHVVRGTYQGILEFLSTFPDGYTVFVVSISGPTGKTHFMTNQYDEGWGFNILEDSLDITFLSF